MDTTEIFPYTNLTEGAISTEQPGNSFYRKYLGGSVVGLCYILNAVQSSANPKKKSGSDACAFGTGPGVQAHM
tara:strand:+ start:105 stop:323 length:219 start_codon:yes stop_codon:yes gene_type:complete